MSADERVDHAIALLRRGDGLAGDAYFAAEVRAAAEAGSAKAARLAAVIAGAGYGVDRDWETALRWLAVAAERGDAEAQAQAALLGAAFDLDAFIAARPARLVVERPRIGVAEGFIDAAFCTWLIARGAPLQGASKVYDGAAGAVRAKNARTNTSATFTILELDLPILLVRERIAATMGVAVAQFERSSVFRYEVGQRFATHADYLDPLQWERELKRWGQRSLTFLIYLNDAFEGGETHFVRLDKKLRGGVGDAVFFYNVDETGVPEPQTLHEGAPPTQGEKWLFSQFIRDRPQLPG